MAVDGQVGLFNTGGHPVTWRLRWHNLIIKRIIWADRIHIVGSGRMTT